MSTKAPDPVDKYVGSRVRMRRIMLGMSQEKLGEALGLTFQQIQKYEKGTNRVGASRIQQISEILQVPVSFLFEGGPRGTVSVDGFSEGTSPAYVSDFLATSEGLALTRAFTRITDAKLRRSIVDLVEQIAARELADKVGGELQASISQASIPLTRPAARGHDNGHGPWQWHRHDRARPAVVPAVSDAAMSVAHRDGAPRSAPSDDGAAGHAHGAFFGRRKGHRLRSHQADLIEKLLPRLALDIASPAPSDLADLFDPRADAVNLEIGFGGGEHLIAQALAFPNNGFIGCEPYINGMAKILTQIEA